MMRYRSCSSQKGLSLIKLILVLLTLLGFLVVVFAILPRLAPNSGVVEIVNQLSQRAQNIMGGITGKFTALGDTLGAKFESVRDRVTRKIDDFKDWWYRYKTRGKTTRSVDWDRDMAELIALGKEYGYEMKEVVALWDLYQDGQASAKRVEAEYWKQIQEQTADAINKSIERFRNRPLGCSDFTTELTQIWTIEQRYNSETLEGYFEAKQLSQELHDPRSVDFAKEFFGWLNYQPADWFMEQLAQAIPLNGQSADYSTIIEKIDARIKNATNPFDCVLGHLTVAEIYLNYDLMDPAQNRFDEALRYLSSIFTRYGNSIPPERLVGLHMAMGLLNERVCRNADLAIKEFKDAIAAARRIALKCEYYNMAHYHLGIINLKLREAKQTQPQYTEAGSAYTGTTEELYQSTPTPAPTPTPTPTPRPNPIKINIEIPSEIFKARTLKATQEGTKARSLTPSTSGVTKGTISTLRDMRLRPRTELGDMQKMKTFSIDQLYDLGNIPDGAIREFEAYLQCTEQGPRVDVARYIHNRYLGK